MSSSFNKIAKDFANTLRNTNTKKPTPYDTQAEVRRVDGDTAWVHIPGGVDETPVQLTTSAKKGDIVQVRVSGGRAWLYGNATNPPTDDTKADEVDKKTAVAVEYVGELNSRNVTAESINAATGYIQDLTSENITTENLKATTGYIQDLTSENITTENIKATTGYIQDLTSENITAEDITADHATVGSLDANYAQIDMANVNNAWIENGAIKKAEVFDENVFDLSGNRATISRIDASKINVANLRADNLVVRRINGQPVVGGYTLISNTTPGYDTKNPQALGWYEFSNGQWVLSTDTEVDPVKAYYQEGDEVSLYDQAYIDGLENDLQQQIDGAVETFTGSVVPTLVNYPYNEWYDTSVTPVHDERAKHVGDIYYVVNSAADEDGYCYRFAFDETNHEYMWVLIKDTDITKALSDISELQTFESETTSWIDETDQGLETIRTNHTALSGRVDAVKATADAALPASTFESFESTTFTDLVDEVDEQSTTMTNMTTRLGLNADGTQSATDIVSKESELEQTVNGISTRVGKTEAHLIGMYATSSTAAGTAAKVATITPAIPSGTNWELGTGTTITVKFTNANTAASPTLNVNGKGAKAIKTYANGNLTEAEYKWAAGSTFTFVYNGTNWLMQDSTASVRMTSNETQINQTATSIESLATGNTTYTKPDGTTGTSAIGTTVSQTANNVLIKATKTDTTAAQGGQHLIQSLINVAPEGVTIDADKVNITGTTIFNKVNADADAKAAMLNSEIEIGGRNFLQNTELFSEWTNCGSGTAGTFSNGVFTYPTITADGWTEIRPNKNVKYDLVRNKTITLSAEVKATSGSVISVMVDSYVSATETGDRAKFRDAYLSPTGGGGTSAATTTADGTWQKVYTTVDITDAFFSAGSATVDFDTCYFGARCARVNTNHVSYRLRHVQIEIGNKATDWSPAPEDIQAEIDAKKSVHTLTSTNTNGANYSTILGYANDGTTTNFGVTSNAGVKIGDTVRIAYKVADFTGKPYVYIVGTVNTVNPNGTNVNITAHGLDTTIIDGGNILTNSIGANQIKANSITTSKLAIGDFNNYIVANENYPDSIAFNGTSVIIEDGWLKKVNAESSNMWLTPVEPNWTSEGEQYRITGIVKAPKAGRAYVYIYGRTGTSADGSVNTGVLNIAANTETHFNHVITINSTVASKENCNIVLAFFEGSTGSTYQIGYCKNMKCERMSGGSLIVDGSITTNKLHAGAVSIGNTDTSIKASLTKADNSARFAKLTQSGTLADATAKPWFKIASVVIDATYTQASITFDVSHLYTGTYDPKGKLNVYIRKDVNGYVSTTESKITWMDATEDIKSKLSDFVIAYKPNDKPSAVEVWVRIPNTYWTLLFKSINETYSTNIDYTRWTLYNNSTSDAKASVTSGYSTIASKVDTSSQYITQINNQGIFISPANQTPTESAAGNSVKIDGTGMNVYNGGDSVAFYGSYARVGKETTAHSVIDADGQRFYASNGTMQLANIGYDIGSTEQGSESTSKTPYYSLGYRRWPSSIWSSSTTYSRGSIVYDATKTNEYLSIIEDNTYPLSNRTAWRPLIGNYSMCEGYSNIAAGYCSHAEGAGSKAIGAESHAEGVGTIAFGQCAHTEGSNTQAQGFCAHAGGDTTIANYGCQTAIGKYNDNKSTNIFEIGYGTATERLNIFEVDINGHVQTIQDVKTTTISNIISANSTNATISSANYVRRGNVAQITISWTNKSAISVGESGNITNINVGTLVSGKRPLITSGAWSVGDGAGAAWYNISTGGEINLGACEARKAAYTIAAGSTFWCCATYLVD